MATIFPFRGYRPRPDLAAELASVPYDVVDRQEARALAEQSRHSFLHVTKPEVDLPDDVSPYDPRVYARGAQALDQLIAQGALRQDDKPCLYAYQLTMGQHTQTGVVLCASVAEYEANLVRKHELTRPDKEDDRVAHIEACHAQTGVVFLVHRDSEHIAKPLREVTGMPPVVSFTAADGVEHRLWVIDSEARIASIVHGFHELGPIYIADGHHRSAAAARVARARRRGNHVDLKAPHERFLAVSFPLTEVQILPYNRVVADLNGLSPEQLLAALEEHFVVHAGKRATLAPKCANLFVDNRWFTLEARPSAYDAGDPVAALDVSIVQARLLDPILGIRDPRRDARIEFVGGIRGDEALEKRVRDRGGLALALHATSVEELLAVADSGALMPPKSTWFEPKLRDGVVVYRY